MRKLRLLSLFGAVSLAVTLICMVGILGGRADEPMGGEVSAALSPYTVLHSFAGGPGDAARPWGSLTLSGTTLYGMSPNGGTTGNGAIFTFDTKKKVETVLYSFGSAANDGIGPNGSFTLSGTTLYGMTNAGGATNNGTIFMFDTKKKVETVLYSFGSVANDGANPCDSLILSGTTLYGMTNAGGANGYGTIFMFDTKKKVETVLYSFGSAANDGTGPYGSLILSGTTLYGMTPTGGANGNGAIFRINTQGMEYKVLYSFGDMPDGANPWGSLIRSGTTLYGMTTNGGANDAGTIFEIKTQGQEYKVLYSFPGWPDAFDPRGSLILSGSTLYGTTDQGGGANGYGTIFMFDTKTNAETVLHVFGSVANDGNYPESGSLTLSGTTLYGKTCWGGANNYGIVFSYSLK